jgi:hypothetical protein
MRQDRTAVCRPAQPTTPSHGESLNISAFELDPKSRPRSIRPQGPVRGLQRASEEQWLDARVVMKVFDVTRARNSATEIRV